MLHSCEGAWWWRCSRGAGDLRRNHHQSLSDRTYPAATVEPRGPSWGVLWEADTSVQLPPLGPQPNPVMEQGRHSQEEELPMEWSEWGEAGTMDTSASVLHLMTRKSLSETKGHCFRSAFQMSQKFLFWPSLDKSLIVKELLRNVVPGLTKLTWHRWSWYLRTERFL